MAQFDPLLTMSTLTYLVIGLFSVYGLSIYSGIPTFVTSLKFKSKRFSSFLLWPNYSILFSLHSDRHIS
jgi:hypothetical protein